jgi:CRISPR-associated protein Csb1
MTVEELYERLARGASLEGEDAAVRIRASYVPSGGSTTKVFPPTYPHPNGQRGQSTYLVEQRYVDGESVPTVLLDSTQSQANRCEEALSYVDVPHLVLDVDAGGTAFSITSLEAPHRSRDAYFRDSLLADSKEKFDESPVGAALASATDRPALACICSRCTARSSLASWRYSPVTTCRPCSRS